MVCTGPWVSYPAASRVVRYRRATAVMAVDHARCTQYPALGCHRVLIAFRAHTDPMERPVSVAWCGSTAWVELSAKNVLRISYGLLPDQRVCRAMQARAQSPLF
jgi:hypothetical protein